MQLATGTTVEATAAVEISPAAVVVELAAANTGGVNVKPLSSALVRILGSTLGSNNVLGGSTFGGAHTMMEDSVKRLAASACSLTAITATVCGCGAGGAAAGVADAGGAVGCSNLEILLLPPPPDYCIPANDACVRDNWDCCCCGWCH